MQHEYQLVDAPDEAAVRRQFEALRNGEVAGANVTVPHKRLALALADRLDASAERIGAANVLCKDETGAIVAYNTDALGLTEVLRRLAPGVPRAVVLGNGGAALAAAFACGQIGVADVVVSARSFKPALDPESWPHSEQFRRVGAHPLPWVGASAGVRACVAQSQLIVQATSAGMRGADTGQALADLLPWPQFAPTTAFYDVVYNPATTWFLSQAKAYGLRAEGGLSMLVAQARLAIQIWLGTLPPEEPLLQAALRALEEFE
jgi:shikimate dehydrogenase